MDFDPFAFFAASFGEIRDVYSLYDRLRQQGTVVEGSVLDLLCGVTEPQLEGLRQFTVLGYEEAMAVNRDPALFSNATLNDYLSITFGPTLTALDPPVHTEVRRVFQRIFLPAQVAKWSETFIDPVIDRLVTDLATAGKAELVEDFAKKYPFQIIYRQLALPEQDIETFHKLAVAQGLMGEYRHHAVEASQKLGAFLTDIVAERRRNPGADLISTLATSEVDGARLEDQFIIAFLRQLTLAAGDTTFRATGTLFAGLLSTPGLLDEVRNDRSLVAPLIEETLRWDGPSGYTLRTATRDTELGGVAIPAGSVVNVSFSAANRDPNAFANPNAFDVHRPKKPHMGFNTGPHMCVGQHLARLEMSRAVNAMLDRFPNMRFDPAQPRPHIEGVVFRTPYNVHVLLD
ncbi:cytochrome P450 [Novosphingobium pentaromativorans US6-1]|uniref:Cytochrome P450 n=1 Tax=Novosphingobium pentaromativorans US6-1 TaxID=1088721 RepID=G6EGN9_9SPHN|nr:cytochrome P450 [Novosphingobium pentaromativorans US6-1]